MKTRYFLFVLLLIASCAKNTKPGGGAATLSPDDFDKKIQGSQAHLIIDVCTPEEFNTQHIQGAVNIDFNNENFSENIGKLDKQGPVFVYCYAGARSKKAVAIMQQMGFKEIYELKGGLKNWISENKPVVK